MKKKRTIILVTLLSVGLVAATAAILFKLSGADIPVLQPKGMIASEQRDLLVFATLIMLIVVVPVFVMTFVFAWKFRASNKKATYKPDWDHSKKLEAIWWGVPCLIIAVLATLTWMTSHSLDPFKPLASSQEPVRIQVVALQWKWLFIYPDEGIATVNHMTIPVNRPVNFDITSDAPMNSFWIPSLAGQIYAMSGMSTKLHVRADEIGVYRGSSANISGEGFAGMKFDVNAVSEDDYKSWLTSSKASEKYLTFEEYDRLAEPSKDNAKTTYALATSGHYDRIIMKYMMPNGDALPDGQSGAHNHDDHSHDEIVEGDL